MSFDTDRTFECRKNDSSISSSTYDTPSNFDPKLAYNMYLISLEIISNATNHASPSEINLEFYGYPDSFVFQFTEDGKGFDTTTTAKGFGLSTIESRIYGMGGEIEIMSSLDEEQLFRLFYLEIKGTIKLNNCHSNLNN